MSNLGKHLRGKHVSAADYVRPQKTVTPSTAASSTTVSCPPEQNAAGAGVTRDDPPTLTVDAIVPSISAAESTVGPNGGPRRQENVQNKLTSYVVRPASVARQKRLDEILLKMIVTDFQPFSIVTDQGFRDYSNALDPSYKLPSRSKLTRELLPRMYADVLEGTRTKISQAEFITLTTDGWTSRNTESYIAVTAHYISSEFETGSCLLDCYNYVERHTAENLSAELQRICREWEIAPEKVAAVVTDNAANQTAAIRLTGFTHLPCFAHSLNLVVQDGVKKIYELRDKVKAIVEFFHRSTLAAEKLKMLQQQMAPESNHVKLKNDVVTRWNSTYDMFRRVLETQQPLSAAIVILHNPVSPLSEADWKVLSEICRLLKPFDAITTEMSSDAVTVSKVIVITQGMLSALQKIRSTISMPQAIELADTVLNSLTQRFSNLEEKSVLARATFLDPRFKKNGFRSDTAYNRVKEDVTAAVTRAIACAKHAANIAVNDEHIEEPSRQQQLTASK